MKLQKNKSYLLNFGRRQGKSTAISNLAVRNAKANPNSTSFILCLHEAGLREVYADILKNNSKRIIKTTYNRIFLNNGSKIFFAIINSNTCITAFRGYCINFMYVDNIDYRSPQHLKMIEVIKDMVADTDYKLIVTANTTVDKLDQLAKLFTQQNMPYEIIIKPCVPQTRELESDLKSMLDKNSIAEELTLGLDYGCFK